MRIGYNVYFELFYKGKFKLFISWLKDGLLLKESEYVRFSKIENKIILSIKNVKKENGGKYIVIFDNVVCRILVFIIIIIFGLLLKFKGFVRFDEIKVDSVIMLWDVFDDDGGGEIICYSIEKREVL